MISLLLKNFPLIAIVGTIGNAVFLWMKAAPKIKEKEELKEGYLKSSVIYAVLLIIPWCVMLAGMKIGENSSVFDYLRIKDGNNYTYAFLASIALIHLMFPLWVFFKNGADFLVKHPGALGMYFDTKLKAKLVSFLFIPFMFIWFFILLKVQGDII